MAKKTAKKKAPPSGEKPKRRARRTSRFAASVFGWWTRYLGPKMVRRWW